MYNLKLILFIFYIVIAIVIAIVIVIVSILSGKDMIEKFIFPNIF